MTGNICIDEALVATSQFVAVLSVLFKEVDFVVCLPYFQRQQDEMLYLRGWLLADGLLFLLYYVVMPVQPEPEPEYSSLSSICNSRGTRRLNQQRVRIKGENRAIGGGWGDPRRRWTFYMRIVETLKAQADAVNYDIPVTLHTRPPPCDFCGLLISEVDILVGWVTLNPTWTWCSQHVTGGWWRGFRGPLWWWVTRGWFMELVISTWKRPVCSSQSVGFLALSELCINDFEVF